MERIKFFREFDEGTYVSENGNITIKFSGKWFIVNVYIHERGKEHMVYKTGRTHQLSDVHAENEKEVLGRLRYVYYPEEHRHSLSIDSYGKIIEFYHDSEMYRRLKM